MKLITHNIPENPTPDQLDQVHQSLRACEQVTEMRVKQLRKQISELRKEFGHKDIYLYELRADLARVEEVRNLEVAHAN